MAGRNNYMDQATFDMYQEIGFSLIAIRKTKAPVLLRSNPSSVHLTRQSFTRYGAVPNDNHLILDIDIKGPKNGLASLALLSQAWQVDLQPNVRTGSGGYHVYCHKPAEVLVKYQQTVYPGIDFISSYTTGNHSRFVVCGNQKLNNGRYEILHWNFISLTHEMLSLLELVNTDSSLEPAHFISSSELTLPESIENTMTLQQVKTCLDLIPSDDYNTWISVGMILYDTSFPERFHLFLDWSMKSNKFKSEADVLMHWSSFNKQNVSVRLSLGSLHYYAVQAKLDRFISLLRTYSVDNQADLVDKLTESNLRDYPAINKLSIQNSLLPKLREVCKFHVELSDIIDALYSTKEKVSELDYDRTGLSSEAIRIINKIRSTFVRVPAINYNFIDIRHHVRVDKQHVQIMLQTELEIDKLSSELNMKSILTVDSLLYRNWIPVVHTVEYHPGKPRLFLNSIGCRVYNEYDANTIPPAADKLTTSLPKPVVYFIQHVQALLGMENARILFSYLAHAIQYPAIKILWVPVLQGAQGLGKSIIGKVIQHHLVGKYHSKVIEGWYLSNEFNGWVANKNFVIIEELHFPDSKEASIILNKLKCMITESTITKNQKYENVTEIPNYCNFLAFTNDMNLPIDPNDRRWWVVKIDHADLASFLDCVGKPAEEYFNALHDLARENSSSGPLLRRYFLDYKIPEDFTPYYAPFQNDMKKT